MTILNETGRVWQPSEPRPGSSRDNLSDIYLLTLVAFTEAPLSFIVTGLKRYNIKMDSQDFDRNNTSKYKLGNETRSPFGLSGPHI